MRGDSEAELISTNEFCLGEKEKERFKAEDGAHWLCPWKWGMELIARRGEGGR